MSYRPSLPRPSKPLIAHKTQKSRKSLVKSSSLRAAVEANRSRLVDSCTQESALGLKLSSCQALKQRASNQALPPPCPHGSRNFGRFVLPLSRARPVRSAWRSSTPAPRFDLTSSLKLIAPARARLSYMLNAPTRAREILLRYPRSRRDRSRLRLLLFEGLALPDPRGSDRPRDTASLLLLAVFSTPSSTEGPESARRQRQGRARVVVHAFVSVSSWRRSLPRLTLRAMGMQRCGPRVERGRSRAGQDTGEAEWIAGRPRRSSYCDLLSLASWSIRSIGRAERKSPAQQGRWRKQG